MGEDVRVCVIASGGLSHFVVDERFDHDIMDAMVRNDFEHLMSYDDGYYQAGSSEIRSWIAAGGVLSGVELDGRDHRLSGFVPHAGRNRQFGRFYGMDLAAY